MVDSSPKYYWDACMFYEWLGRETVPPARKTAVRELLEDNKAKKNVIVTSVITNLEILPKKLDAKAADAEERFLKIFDGVHFIDIEVSRNILIRAREIRNYYYRPADPETGEKFKMMDAADAIHLATASIYGVKEFHTRDDDRKGSKIPLVTLYDWAGETSLCGQYPLAIVSPESDQSDFNFDGGQNGTETKPAE